MKGGGLASTIVKVGVVVYLAIIGIFGFRLSGQIYEIFKGLDNKTLVQICVYIFSAFAILAALGTLLEMFGQKIKILNTLLFVVAIVWAVYILISLIIWIINGFGDPLTYLLGISVAIIVCGQLLAESERFS